MGSQERRAREKVHLKRAILDAARELFAHEGYHAVSMRRIAQKIEYSPTTLYLYFQDKRDILRELIIEGFHLLCDRVDEPPHPDPIERLQKVLRCYLAFAFEQPHYYALMFQLEDDHADSPKDPQILEAGGRAFEILRGCVREAQADGRVRTDFPEPILSHTIWAHIHGVAALALARRLEMLPEEFHPALYESVLAVTIQGIRAR